MNDKDHLVQIDKRLDRGDNFTDSEAEWAIRIIKSVLNQKDTNLAFYYAIDMWDHFQDNHKNMIPYIRKFFQDTDILPERRQTILSWAIYACDMLDKSNSAVKSDFEKLLNDPNPEIVKQVKNILYPHKKNFFEKIDDYILDVIINRNVYKKK
jgi:sulfur relay (sulfurtransferase) DsrC/TusE family protein